MAHRLLIVDDEPAIVMVLQEVLSGEGFAVSTAPDGRSALEALRTVPPPDIVLLDLRMPDLSGQEVLAAMRADPNLRYIPVILITASVGDLPPKDDYQALIPKPFDVMDVLSTVDLVVLSYLEPKLTG